MGRSVSTFAAWIQAQVICFEKEAVVMSCWGLLASEYKVFCLLKRKYKRVCWLVSVFQHLKGRSRKLKASKHYSKKEEVHLGI